MKNYNELYQNPNTRILINGKFENKYFAAENHKAQFLNIGDCFVPYEMNKKKMFNDNKTVLEVISKNISTKENGEKYFQLICNKIEAV